MSTSRQITDIDRHPMVHVQTNFKFEYTKHSSMHVKWTTRARIVPFCVFCLILCSIGVLNYIPGHIDLHVQHSDIPTLLSVRGKTENNCLRLVRLYTHELVTDRKLDELLDRCHNSVQILNPTTLVFNVTILDSVIQGIHCPHSADYLSVTRPLVAMASFPGSGNTWTRELIETVTGIHTGSVYSDWNFNGSKSCPSRGRVFIVKTHRADNITQHVDCKRMGVTRMNYSKAIYILRNPYDVLLAEFNRRRSYVGSHNNSGVGIAAHNDFFGKQWRQFIEQESNNWKRMTLYWLKRFDKSVYVLRYDVLERFTVKEIYKVTKFLRMMITFKSLYCISSKTVGNYRRVKPSWMTKTNLFDTKLRKIVNSVIKSVIEETNMNDLHQYMLPEN